MNVKCFLGFHEWEIDKKQFALICKRCGKQKITPVLAVAGFTKNLQEINMRANDILALLMLGRTEEAKAKLQEWKKEMDAQAKP
jgi:ABC-type Fe3+-citrate transport system substrate-binding protein